MSLEKERFDDLLESYIDRSLSEDESRELLEAFAEDETLKPRFLEEMRIAHSLKGLSSLKRRVELTEDVIESIRLGRESPDLSEPVLSELRQSEKKVVTFPFTRVALGVAAALVAGFFVFVALPPASDSSLATVAHVIDAEWGGGEQLAEGARIRKGRVKLASGVARLDFADGVRVTLEGPAEFELIGPGETRLHSGNLTAHVPPAGIGFQVHTERVEIVDLGTTFGVSVGENGATDVEVLEGEVEVKSARSGKEKIITEGNGVTVDESTDELALLRIRPIEFKPDWPILFGVKNTGGRIRFVNRQPIRNPNEVVDRENIVVFPERFGARPEGEVEATFSSSGTHSMPTLKTGVATVSLEESERVNSYLLQYNPPYVEGIPNSEQVDFSGRVTFDRPILAVISDTEKLIATDSILGKRRFEYPTNPSRGLEHGDSLTLSDDRHTLEVNWRVMQALKQGLDQIRVIVSADGPVSTQQGQVAE